MVALALFLRVWQPKSSAKEEKQEEKNLIHSIKFYMLGLHSYS